ncbi:DegQ family serine endoprotease [Algicola sagamiensis]|uniref:DegQ family serine endoprotease n=1 Tax=Algicola sagamiensis TaxID=163869 RepID=UPI00036E90E4|nr:DegQ family serine endoprotease [Algicola sagamiensis]
MKKQVNILASSILSAALLLSPAVSHAKLPFSFGSSDEVPSLAPMLEKTTPAVVNISVAGSREVKQNVPDAFRYFFGPRTPRQYKQEQPFKGLGSGVIIDADEGYVVTNNHVVDEADEILITLKDGRRFPAKKLGSDKESDIALLQIEADNLTEVRLADSDQLRVGDFAVAIGNPFGLGQTVTSGIISALGRSGLNIEGYEDFIQTDAAINRGNSGGALVDLKGQLIGINTAIIGPGGGNVGIGFAIPANMMKNLVDQIIQYGEVKRGHLGITGQPITPDLKKAMKLETNKGAFIQQVMKDSAAEEAGLKPGDVITSINGKKINSFFELRAKIGTIGAGKTLKIGIIRDGDEKTVTATLKEPQGGAMSAKHLHPAFEGVQLDNGKTGDGDKGIEVVDINKRSIAARYGLQEGDVIVAVNRTRVTDLKELRKVLRNTKGLLVLNIIRENTALFIQLR